MMQMYTQDSLYIPFITIRKYTQNSVPVDLAINNYTLDSVVFFKPKNEHVHTG